jgi:hypothetical protein
MNYVALNCLEELGFPINENHFGVDVGYPDINAWRLPPYPPISVAEHIGETHPVSIQSFETPEDWRHFNHMRQRIPAIHRSGSESSAEDDDSNFYDSIPFEYLKWLEGALESAGIDTKAAREKFEKNENHEKQDHNTDMNNDMVRISRNFPRCEAHDIDFDGVWHSKYGSIDLIGKMVPITKSMRRGKYKEEVLMIAPAKDYVKECRECGEEFPDGTIVLAMETARMIPAHCCNKILWYSDYMPEGSLYSYSNDN